MLTQGQIYRTVLVAAVVPGVMLLGGTAFAGPQDDPPVNVTAGGPLLAGAESTFTLTLDSAGHAGDLEPGAIQAAVQAAAKVNAAEAVSKSNITATAVLDGATEASVAQGGEAAVSSGECAWRDASNLPASDPAWGGNNPAAGTLLVNICNGPSQYLFVPNSAPGAAAPPPPPPPPPDPAVLAQQAYAELTVPNPVAKRSPPENNSDPQYGGQSYTWIFLWTYVWAGEWQSYSRTVELRGVSATVTATPTALVFDPGDGAAAVTCEGPGRPWTPADGSDPPSAGACGYMYRAVTPNGPLTATTSIQWSVAWTSNVGAGGTFPVLTTQSSSSFLVEQIQVVIK
jgi:hypothetical protein